MNIDRTACVCVALPDNMRRRTRTILNAIIEDIRFSIERLDAVDDAHVIEMLRDDIATFELWRQRYE